MNAAIQPQISDNTTLAINSFQVLEVKHCSCCNVELPQQQDNRRTSFGLNLCDDCLYS